MQAAIERGPHKGTLVPGTMEYARKKAWAKEKAGQCKIVKWKDINDDPPQNLKLRTVAAVPHKSRDYRMILDLSFALRMCGYEIPAVNEETNPLAPEEALVMLGSALPRMIATIAEEK